jgi:drug/metabolite transporter (DMT)-like permease
MLPLRGKTELMLSRIGADALILWVSAAAGAVILGAGWEGCLGTLGYVLFWMAAAVLAAFLFSEIPSVMQITGGILILGGVLYYSRLEQNS